MELIVDIKKRIQGFTLEVSFYMKENPVGFLGASGSGKSMTLRCIAGLETPDKGRIILDGRTFFDSEKGINLPSQERKIGFLFQHYALFPHMTVEENIGFALYYLSKLERKRVIKEKIQMMQLEGLENRYPSQISGGQQQRVALARALAIEPKALLLDEPFSALDNHLRNQIEKQLLEALENYHGTTLFVTHNIDEAYRVCKNLMIFSDGKIVAKGDKEEVFASPPTFQAAQLTGCKNIIEARKHSDNQVRIPRWNVILQMNKLVPDDMKYVGIRAHYLKLSENPRQINTYECWVSDISESTFRVMVYLELKESSDSNTSHDLLWDISKERWLQIKDRTEPWYIHIDPEKVFPI